MEQVAAITQKVRETPTELGKTEKAILGPHLYYSYA
jgi:hypothetical protein